jgi:diadenylate cyclase
MLDILRPTFVDFIDVGVVAIIVYLFLAFIKGTRAFQILIGLVLIFLVSLVARTFNLSALSLILDSLMAIWIIAFVILFQPEIRNALARMGRYRVLRFLVRSVEQLAVSDIIKAVEEMRKRKIGAIIAFERDIDLGEYVRTGTRLDAKVSAPLIVSIFTPPSPLHDGACIIRRDVLVAAACILPVSEEPWVEDYYGMRHRAALGICSGTDAISVVVSEETGGVSVGMEGKLYSNLEIKELTTYLEKVYTKEEK